MARIKEYWLQLESHPWDTAPWGANRLTGRPLPKTGNGLYRPAAREMLLLRRTTAEWGAPDDRSLNPWDLTEPDPATTQGTIPGPVLTAKVADEIIVHFRNMDMRAGIPEARRTHSLHAHGVQAAAIHSGMYPLSPPDPAQGGRRGDRVPPGESFTYRWTCPHKAAAGTWLYGDAATDGLQSVGLGAFGVLVIQAPGEQPTDEPPESPRRAGDTSVRFAAVPQPPKRADYILAFHEMPGAGLCLNGRTGLGNTPALVAGNGTRMTVRCLNACSNPVTVHIDGHRWEHGNYYTDIELLPPGGGSTLSILSGSAEGGGGSGEWLVTARSGNMIVHGTILSTPGGTVELQSA